MLAFFLALAGAGGAGAMYFVTHLPSASHFSTTFAFQNARIFDSRGALLYNMADLQRHRGRRIVEPLQPRGDSGSACRGGTNRIPLLLQNASIATEDATFYKNPGFDVLSILRAAYQDLSYGHIVSGASTITQQVVRDVLLHPRDRSLARKADEVALAYEVAHRFSKRKILWYYLNSIPYGNQAFGAQAAAQVYFQEPACRLDLAQAALLAGLPRAPTYYDPVRHHATALGRMNEVLRLMRIHGYITGAHIRAAQAEAQHWQFAPPAADIRYPQFVRYAVDQIQRMPALREDLYKGIDVYTTLDSRLQDLAQSAVTSQIDGLVDKHVTDGALVSLDLQPSHYGWVVAMVGSAHYSGRAGQINMTTSPRQPGSSMKPFNYIWAFQHGVGPGTTVLDDPIILPDPNNTTNHGWYEPTNYDHQYHGLLTFRQALANSLNVPALKLEYYITGSRQVAQTAYRYGMTSLYRDNPGIACNTCYSVTLGGLAHGTRLLEETSAYGVFASGGQTVPPVAIWKVVKRSTGRVLYCSEDCPRGVKPDPEMARERQRVLDPAHAYEMTNVLADNSARCTPQVCEFGLINPLVLTHPAAAKTGTTNDFSDNWTVGYTPQIVTGVWTGNADRTAMVNVIGITGAAPIWNQFMEGAFKLLKLPSVPFSAPANVIRTAQCTVPGTTVTGIGFSDLYVVGDHYPLCRLPEKGAMPISCAQYPRPYPLGWQCPTGYSYRYTYGYGSTQPGTGYPPGTTYPPGAFNQPPAGNGVP